MWVFLIGVIVGAVVAIFLLVLISAMPDPEDGGEDDDKN